MAHPYKTYKTVPCPPSECRLPSEEKLNETFNLHLKAISRRNRQMIPPEIYENLRKS